MDVYFALAITSCDMTNTNIMTKTIWQITFRCKMDIIDVLDIATVKYMRATNSERSALDWLVKMNTQLRKKEKQIHQWHQ